MINIPNLIARLQGLEEPLRDVDDIIWRWVNDNKVGITSWQYDLKPPPIYTRSIDVIVVVIEAREYDWICGSVNGAVGGTPYACVGSTTEHFSCNAAASLCLAFFRLELVRAENKSLFYTDIMPPKGKKSDG